MAGKYSGQNALDKLMHLVKTALNSKADKTNATTSAAGLMSATDKTKLDGIAAGATKITVDSEMSASSANPVMNGTITVKLSGKADKTDLDRKLDKAGGTITGNLKVNGDFEPVKGLTTSGGINAQSVSTPVLALHDNGVAGANASINVSGVGAVEVTVPDGDKRAKARLKIGTPTEDDDATTRAYVDSKVAAGGVTVDTEMSSTSTNPVQNKTVKGYVDNKVSGLQTAAQVQDAIRSAITGVYTPKGSNAFASLPVPVAGKVGWVYNITDAFTTDSNFVEGEGRDYPAGTNVVCAEISAGDYGWDVLAGTIDLTELTADEVQKLWDSI